MLRPLPVSDRDTDVEIPTLRHQLMVVARQLGKDRVRCTPSDRAFLAGGAAASAATGDAARAASGGRPVTVLPQHRGLMERWMQTCRRELPDRTLIWNRRQLLYALREFEQFYHSHRAHQGIANARPPHPLPTPITIRNRTPAPTYEDPTALAAPSTHTGIPHDPHGWDFRQAFVCLAHYFRRETPADCLATALQSRIRHSRPGSDLSAGGRQGALPRLDAGRSQRPGRPRATCLRKPTQRHHRQSAHPCRMGSATPCSHPERRSRADKGPYASRCTEHPNRPGDPRSLRLTTAHRGAVRHRTTTGSGDGQTGRR